MKEKVVIRVLETKVPPLDSFIVLKAGPLR